MNGQNHNITKDIIVSIKTLTLAAGERRRIDQPGRYFLLVSNSLSGVTDLEVSFGMASGYQPWPVLFSARVENQNDFFDSLSFYNPSGSSMTIEYLISNLIIENRAAEVTGSITIPIDDTTNGTSTPASITALPVDGFLIDNAAAVNVGGGVVGIPVATNPFIAGESVTITGTTNYNSTYTVLGSSTASQVNITETYAAETFDGVDDTIALTTPRSIPADTTRKELHIANHDTSYNVFWGDININAADYRGVPIIAESVYIITCTDQIYVCCEDGAGKTGCTVSWCNKTKT
jgi:hypothetical protein